jgi:hypothetical protein
MTACVSTMPSREKLSSTLPFFMIFTRSALIRFLVVGSSGMCRLTKSECLSSSSTLAAFLTCEAAARRPRR